MSNPSNLPFLIAGGGIGGLASALALARQGFAVELFEQGEAFGEIGAGIQLGPNVFRMFERLGLSAAIERYAVHPEHLIMMDGISGERVARIAVGSTAFTQRFGGYPYGVIHRGDLHQVLLEACQSQPTIRLHTQRKVVAHQDQSNHVEVTFDSGDAVHGTALIGADGLWSRVRAQLLNDGPPRVSGHIAYRAVLPRAQVPNDLWRNDVVLWAGAKTHLVHYPLRRGELFNLVAVFHSDKYAEGWDVYGDPAELRAKFQSGQPQVQQLLEKINTWRMWVLCDRDPVREWSRGRVTLLGDAAHPTLQYLAQGANMAIEDAVVLAACVKASPADLPAALRRYQDLRYLRTARVQMTSRFYGDIYHAAGVVRELRNQLLAPAGGFEAMAWLYDGIDVEALVGG